MGTNHASWIIIGSGPGAAAVASVLVKKLGPDLLMLERGIDPRTVNVPAHSLKEMRLFAKNSGMNFVPGLNPVILSEARVLGGGSQINSGIYRPLPEAKRRSWEEAFKIESFQLKPFQAEVEKILRLQHSTYDHVILSDLKQAALNLGYDWNECPS